jgi:hypothetical protein
MVALRVVASANVPSALSSTLRAIRGPSPGSSGGSWTMPPFSGALRVTWVCFLNWPTGTTSSSTIRPRFSVEVPLPQTTRQ